MPSVTGIIVYRGLYFGLYDSIKPVLLTGSLEGNFLASFGLGWAVTTGAGIASYPLDTIRRRMMMTSGEVCTARESYQSSSPRTSANNNCRPSSTSLPSMPVARSLPRRVSSHSSRALEPTSSVVLLVPVCSPSTTRPNCSCSARSSLEDPVKRLAPQSNYLETSIEILTAEEAACIRWSACL